MYENKALAVWRAVNHITAFFFRREAYTIPPHLVSPAKSEKISAHDGGRFVNCPKKEKNLRKTADVQCTPLPLKISTHRRGDHWSSATKKIPFKISKNRRKKNPKFAVKKVVKFQNLKPSKMKKRSKIDLYGGFWAFLALFTVWT